MVAWATVLRRSVDYLQSRDDRDVDRLGYLGISWGGAVAPVLLAREQRIRPNAALPAVHTATGYCIAEHASR